MKARISKLFYANRVVRIRQKKIVDSKFNFIGHLHDEFILLLRLESFSVFLSCANKCFCLLNLAGITNFEYEGENEKVSGRNSKMTPSCIWSIVE